MAFDLVLLHKISPKSTLECYCYAGKESTHKKNWSFFLRKIWNILCVGTNFTPCSTGIIFLTSLSCTWMRRAAVRRMEVSADKGILPVINQLPLLEHYLNMHSVNGCYLSNTFFFFFLAWNSLDILHFSKIRRAWTSHQENSEFSTWKPRELPHTTHPALLQTAKQIRNLALCRLALWQKEELLAKTFLTNN